MTIFGVVIYGIIGFRKFRYFCIDHLHKLNICEPSAIQKQGIPMALSGRDLVGISCTGSGKTFTSVKGLN